MKKSLSIILLLLFFGVQIYAESHVYSDDDIGRIVYCRPNIFLVVDSISQTGLNCHTYGKTKKYKVKFEDATPTRFYENSSLLMITQYALRDYSTKRRNGFAGMLARLCGDTTGRIEKIDLQEAALKKLEKALQTIKTSSDYSEYPEERIDAYLDVLDTNWPSEQIQDAAVSGDWQLAAALSIRVHEYMNTLPQRLNTSEVVKPIQDKLAETNKVILEDFSKQMRLENTRRKLFKKHYPYSKGLWSMSPPASFQGFINFYQRSMNAFFNLDNLSKVTETQDWGSAVLDVLLMCEGTPGAAVLEKEFDEEIRKLEQVSSGTNK